MGRRLTVGDPSALCIQCGLCCDGTLFTRVRLADEDHLPLGAGVQRANDRQRWLPQPCAFLGVDGCHIYSNRPRPCQDFECLLLQAVNAGEIDLEEARQLIDQTKQMIRMAKTSNESVLQNFKLRDWIHFYFGHVP